MRRLVGLVLGALACSAPGVDAPATPGAGHSAKTAGPDTPGDGDAGTVQGQPPEAGPPDPGPPRVRYVGRLDPRDPAGPRLGWAGERVIVRFQGTSLSANVVETNLYKGPSNYDVIVDGQTRTPPLVPPDGPSARVIAKDLTPGEHVVELWRRTEGQVGITQFTAFDFGGGQLLPPPPARARRIEFLGDSESAGYGVECANANESFSGATENARKAFPALIAEAVSAEHSNISYSGKGVLRNFQDDDTTPFAAMYVRSLPDDATSSWSFDGFVPDLVFIALGTNDFQNATRPMPDVAAFKARYHDPVALVRAKNPNAQILCVVEADVNDAYPVGWNSYANMTTVLKAVAAERAAPPINDARVHYYELPRLDSSGPDGAPDATACDGHPNAAYHQKAALDAATKVKAVMGW